VGIWEKRLAVVEKAAERKITQRREGAKKPQMDTDERG